MKNLKNLKNLKEIYDSILSTFKSKTNLNIHNGSVIDKYTISIASAIENIYKEIENNKNPHIYTNLSGQDIDSVGILVGCPRRENEDDSSYLYRMLNWNVSNQCGNNIAFETALMNLKYSSIATPIPFTQGVGTSTIYIIPKSLDEKTKELAIEEVKERIENIKPKTSYIEYLIPKILKTSLVIYLSVYRDEENVKENITKKIEDYINNIAPGEKLELGALNKIGNAELNSNYFSVSSVIIDNKELQDLNIVQKLEEKFVFDAITWNMVVND